MGAFGDVKTDAEGLTKIAAWKGLAETKAGTTFSTFEVVHYATQVVSGINYKAKVKVGDDAYAHITVWEKLPHTNEQPECTNAETGKTLEDAL